MQVQVSGRHVDVGDALRTRISDELLSAIASSAGGEAHSAEAVRHKIRQLIEGEAGEGDVHSDDSIVDVLKGAGVDIARRTVAKYREAMRIPSSVERKRLLREVS